MKNDLVYILGTGSTWANNEIKFSLRSVEKHLQDFNKVFIVGECPHFFNENVIHVPHKDVYTNRARNIMAKIYKACNTPEISDNFMFFNDDYFILKPFSVIFRI